MKFTSREQNGVVVIKLHGKMMGSPEDSSLVNLIHESAEQNKVKVVFELSEVDWMNSRGLGILVSGLTTLRNRGGDLKLACISESIDSFLNKCKMLAIFESYKTVEEAIESFKSNQ